jgi:hypothetical protein
MEEQFCKECDKEYSFPESRFCSDNCSEQFYMKEAIEQNFLSLSIIDGYTVYFTSDDDWEIIYENNGTYKYITDLHDYCLNKRW